MASGVSLNLSEHVNAYARLSPADEHKSLSNQELWYNVALKVAPVAYIALSVTAIWFAASWSVAIGMAAIAGSVLFFQEIFVCYIDASLREQRDKATLDRAICELVIENENDCKGENAWLTNAQISSHGGNPYSFRTEDGQYCSDNAQITKVLLPLFNRFQAMSTVAQRAQAHIDVRREELRNLTLEVAQAESSGNLELERFRQDELRVAALKAEIHHLEESHNVYAGTYGLAESKIAAAYYRHLLRNPTDKRKIADFGTITRQNLFFRNTTGDQCYFFTKEGRRIDKAFFLNHSIPEIQARLFGR